MYGQIKDRIRQKKIQLKSVSSRRNYNYDILLKSPSEISI